MGLTIFIVLLSGAIAVAFADYLRGRVWKEYQVHLLFALQIMVVLLVIATFVFLSHHR